MTLQEIKGQYFSDISKLVENGNLKFEESDGIFHITVQVFDNYERIANILSKLNWTMNKLQKVAKVKTDMKIEFVIKNADENMTEDGSVL